MMMACGGVARPRKRFRAKRHICIGRLYYHGASLLSMKYRITMQIHMLESSCSNARHYTWLCSASRALLSRNWRIFERYEVMANGYRTISRLPDIEARLEIPETRRRGVLRQCHCIKWRFPSRHIGGNEGQSYELIFLICNRG